MSSASLLPSTSSSFAPAPSAIATDTGTATALSAAKQELNAAEEKLKAAEEKLNAAEEKLKAAKEQLKEAKERGDPDFIEAAIAQLRATTQGLQTAQNGVESAQNGVTTAQNAVTHWTKATVHQAQAQAQLQSQAQAGSGTSTTFPANPGVLLCPSVGRVATRSAAQPEGHYSLSGQFAAVAPHVLVTAQHVCFATTGVQHSLKVLWRPVNGAVVVLSAAVLEHDAEMDVAVLVVLDTDAPPFTPLPIADASIIHAHTSSLLCGIAVFPVSRDHRRRLASGDVAELPSFEESAVQAVDALGPGAFADAADSANAAAAAAAASSYLVGSSGYGNEAGYSGGAVVGLGAGGQLVLLGVHTDSEYLGSREEVQVESGDSEYEPSSSSASMSTSDSNLTLRVTQREVQQLTTDATRPPTAGLISSLAASAAPAPAATVVSRRVSSTSTSSSSSAAMSGRSLFVVVHSAFSRRGWQLPQLVAAAAQRRRAHTNTAYVAAPPAPFQLITRSRSRIQQRSPELFTADQLYNC